MSTPEGIEYLSQRVQCIQAVRSLLENNPDAIAIIQKAHDEQRPLTQEEWDSLKMHSDDPEYFRKFLSEDWKAIYRIAVSN